MSSTTIFIFFLLGILIDYRFINVFSITYPFQILVLILNSVFATSQNICAKSKLKNIQDEGIVTGTVIGLILFISVGFFANNYINFMNMDADIYHDFVLLSILLILFQYISSLILEKLYFNNQNKEANFYNLIFNGLAFLSIIGTALITKEIFIIILVFTMSSLIYTFWLFYKIIKRYKINLLLILNIRYDSVSVIQHFFLFLIYLFGLGNINQFGEEYSLAMSFAILVTDVQWDIVRAVRTTTIVQITNKAWNYKKHLRDSYLFTLGLIVSVVVIVIILYPVYKPNMVVFSIILLSDFLAFLAYPMYTIKKYMIQLNLSAKTATSFNVFNNLISFGCSYLNTPYCTTIGHVLSSLIQFFGYNYLYKRLKGK